ncbi:uncharacterized protein [Dendropsophus ebraccatus]|uniref:uncharacterized protein n=1 Tax=Dendropsophus ebraccatus TaxID=150705 RepID=UPI0038319B9D
MIKLWNEAWKPSSFMLDFCLEEINAIEQVFPDAEIFLCDFHREKAWTEWLNKKDHGVHKRKKEILALMRNVALTTNKEEHERALKTLTSSPIWKQSKMLRQWFSQKWLSDIKKWAHIYRKGTQVIIINTNNGLERQHETLKYSYLDGYKNCTLSEMIGVLHHRFFPDTFKKYMEKNLRSCGHYRKYAVSVPLFLRNRPQEFIKHTMQRYFSSLDETHVLEKDEQNGVFKVKSESEKDLIYTVTLGGEMPACECKDWQRYLMPCKHMCAIFRLTEYKWEKLNPTYSLNPLFLLDSECFKNILELDLGTDFELLDTSKCPSLYALSNTLIKSLPPRRRKNRNILIRVCSQYLKQLQDLVFVSDEEYLTELSVTLKDLVAKSWEKAPKDHGLMLQDITPKIVVQTIKDLPQRQYGKSKQPDLRRFGLQADKMKEDVWETLPDSDEAEVFTTEITQSIWVTVSKFRLSMKDREVITKNEWLDDHLINACQFLLSKRRDEVSGFIDSAVMSHTEVPLLDCNEIIQIHHVGAHWLVSHRLRKDVTIYDSMAVTTFSDSLKKQIIKLYKPLFDGENEVLKVKSICCQKQKGASDCGLFAIANALALLEGINLKKIQFIQADMRPHLVSCLEKGQLVMFPYVTRGSRKIYIQQIILTTLCTCHIYQHGEPMVECSKCKCWYHFSCVSLDKDDKRVKTKRKFYCDLCTK